MVNYTVEYFANGRWNVYSQHRLKSRAEESRKVLKRLHSRTRITKGDTRGRGGRSTRQTQDNDLFGIDLFGGRL